MRAAAVWFLAFLVLSGHAHASSSRLERLEALLHRNGQASKGRLHKGAAHALTASNNLINAALAQISKLMEAPDSGAKLGAAADELADLVVGGFSRGSSLCSPSVEALSDGEVAAFKETLELGKKVLEARKNAAVPSETEAALIQQAQAHLGLLESSLTNDNKFDDEECGQISQEHMDLLTSALDAADEAEDLEEPPSSAPRFASSRSTARTTARASAGVFVAGFLIASVVLAGIAVGARSSNKVYCSLPRILRVSVPTHYPGKIGSHAGVPTADDGGHDCSEKVQCVFDHLRENNVVLSKNAMLGVAYDNDSHIFYGTASGYLPPSDATNALSDAFDACDVTTMSLQEVPHLEGRVEAVVNRVSNTWNGNQQFRWERQGQGNRRKFLAAQVDGDGNQVERGNPAGVCAGTKLAMHINWPKPLNGDPTANDPMFTDRMTCLAEAWYTKPSDWKTVNVLDGGGTSRHYCPGDLVPSCLTCQHVINELV